MKLTSAAEAAMHCLSASSLRPTSSKHFAKSHEKMEMRYVARGSNAKALTSERVTLTLQPPSAPLPQRKHATLKQSGGLSIPLIL